MSGTTPHEAGWARVHVTFSEGTPMAGETVWARPPGSDRYRVANIPFFVEDFGLDDVVRAVDGEFVEVVERTGHVTVDIVFGDVAHHDRQRVLNALRAHGVRVERALGPLFAADVPPQATGAFSVLEGEETSGTLQWARRTETTP